VQLAKHYDWAVSARLLYNHPDAFFTQLTGWRATAVAWTAGVASVLSLAPFFWWPVLFVTLPVLAWLLEGAGRPRRAAVIGWWFAFGYFLFGLFWIGEAFLVEAETFLWALPFAVTLLPAGLALFWAAATAAAVAITPPMTPARADPYWLWQRLAALALALSAAEWLRGHVLTGLPWNVLGYALTAPDTMMQAASVLGIYGLTLLAVVVFVAPAVIWSGQRLPAHRWQGGAVAAVAVAAIWLYGATTLRHATTAMVPDVRLRVVQPSILQTEKWRPENQRRIFDEHLDLSTRKPDGTADGLAGISLVIWPEASMPFQPLKSPEALGLIGDLLPDGTYLVAGALRTEDLPASGPGMDEGPRREVFNSLMAFGRAGNTKGALVALYDKIHLVPFGEYLPVSSVLAKIGLRQLTRMRGGMTANPGPRSLFVVPGLPAFGPLICYEAIFPGAVMPVNRPTALINVTNDGWFGNTTGPRQHLHQARVRAVEEGLPLVRAANNGISAVIDAHGRIVGRLDMNVRGSLDSGLPVAAAPTWYARFGDRTFFLFWGLLALGLAYSRGFGRTATAAKIS
jgi:apolipoprotein N-acyltransferase